MSLDVSSSRPLPSISPNPMSRRQHRSSLSIARSPSILASSFGSSINDDLESGSFLPSISHHRHSSSTSYTTPRMKPVILPPTLLEDEELNPKNLGRTVTLPTPHAGDHSDRTFGRTSTLPVRLPGSISEEAEHVSPSPLRHSVDGYGYESDDEEPILDGGRGGLTLGFQAPDKEELTWMILSGIGVMALSIAACMATIYDWVL